MQNWAEYAGYAASFFIVGSFIFKDLRTIRALNLVGCLCFVFYGFFSKEDEALWPIIVPNALLSAVQIFYLIQMVGEKNEG